MKYILDNNGYVESASCNPISCDDKVSQEYTGSIPSGYDSLDDWILNANIRAYKISGGNLVYDSARDAQLTALWSETDGYGAAVGKASKNLFISNVSGSLNGISYSVNGSEITLSGTASANVDMHLYDRAMFTEYNGRPVSMSANGLVNNVKISCCNSSWGNTQTINSTTNTKTFTINNNIRYLWINVLSGTTVNATIKLQIELGLVATEYEEYYPPVIAAVDSNGAIHEVGNNYSLGEQIIGTWIDGKPLYRKVIQSTLPNATTDGTAVSKNISIGTTVDVCLIKNCYYWDDYNGIIPMLWINGSGHVMRCYADVPANNLVLYNSNVSISGNKFLAIIEYTKK